MTGLAVAMGATTARAKGRIAGGAERDISEFCKKILLSVFL
jgi:hypothetical protein